MSDVVICPMPGGCYLHRGHLSQETWDDCLSKFVGVTLNDCVVTKNESLFSLLPGQSYRGGRVDTGLKINVPPGALFWLELHNEQAKLPWYLRLWRTLQSILIPWQSSS